MKFILVESEKLKEAIVLNSDYQSAIDQYLVPALDDWQKKFIKGICEKGIHTEKQLAKYTEIVNNKLSKWVDTDTGETLSSMLLECLYEK